MYIIFQKLQKLFSTLKVEAWKKGVYNYKNITHRKFREFEQESPISTISMLLLRHSLFFLGNTLKAGRPALSHVLSIVSKCTRAIRM